MKTNKIIKTLGMSTVGVFSVGAIIIPTMVLSSCSTAETKIIINTKDDRTDVTQSYKDDITLDITATVPPDDISNPIEWTIKGILPEYEKIITLVPNETDKNKASLTIKKGEEITQNQKVIVTASCGKLTGEIEITINAFNNAEKLQYAEVEGGYSVEAVTGVTISGDLTIPNIHEGQPVIAIQDSGFSKQTHIANLTFENNLTIIGANAFGRCSGLINVIIPDNVIEIGASSFENCANLTEVTLSNKITTINSSTFQQCYSLTSIIIPDEVLSVASSAFLSCTSLISVTLGAKLQIIEDLAFSGCTSLSDITIPDTVITIEANAFSRCAKLASITFNSITPPTLADDVFKDIDSNYKIYVPKDAFSTYQAATVEMGWTAEIKTHLAAIN